MAKTIRIEDWKKAAQAEVTLGDGRELKLRRPVFRAQDQAVWATRRPGWGNAKAAAEVILLHAYDGELSSAELRVLNHRDRRRLIVAVVRLVGAEEAWRRLYGTSLDLDERLFATMIWVERREVRQMLISLREIQERLIERPRIDAQAIVRSIAGASGITKQMAAIDSLTHAAKIAGLGSRFQFPGAALKASELSVANGLGSYPGVASVAGAAKASMLHWGCLGKPQVDLKVIGPAKGLASGLVGAGLRAEMPMLVAHMREHSITEKFTAAKFAEGVAGIPSISKQLDFTPGILGWGTFKPPLSSALIGEGSIARSLPMLDPTRLGFGNDIWRQTQRTFESLLLAEMARLWDEDPLWFLISHLDPRKLPALLQRDREEVYEAVFNGLEQVVRDSTLIEQLFTACEEIGFLTSEQREWIRHGLRHAREGEWLQAMPPLTCGFEGAIFSGAVAAKAIATREGKKLGAEKVIKAVQLGEELEVFAIRLVFGGRGNAFRHGRPEHKARDQALLQIVALVGWVDFTLGTSGTARLASKLETPLASVLGAGRQRELTAA